jgi:two-component system response regulator QseB
LRALLVEDDMLLGEGLRVGLSQHDIVADWVSSCSQALAALETDRFDAIVLDLGLPDGDGRAVLQRSRSLENPLPVLVLTARDRIDDKLTCLDGGADDYVVKPVDIRELAARLRSLLRRRDGRASPVLCSGSLKLDPAKHKVTVEDTEVPLTVNEFRILHALLRSPGAVISKNHLEQLVYGWQSEVESNALQVHLHNLRRKVGHDVIRTIRGVGYVIEKKAA